MFHPAPPSGCAFQNCTRELKRNDYLPREAIPSLNGSINKQKYFFLKKWTVICYSGISVMSSLCNAPVHIKWISSSPPEFFKCLKVAVRSLPCLLVFFLQVLFFEDMVLSFKTILAIFFLIDQTWWHSFQMRCPKFNPADMWSVEAWEEQMTEGL